VVSAELGLNALGRQGEGAKHHASVVDDNIQWDVEGEDARSIIADRVKVVQREWDKAKSEG
jgi:hypothetical protein